MPSFQDNRNFIEYIISSDFLEYAIDWVGSNLDPEDVFTNEALIDWALDNKFIKETE